MSADGVWPAGGWQGGRTMENWYDPGARTRARALAKPRPKK